MGFQEGFDGGFGGVPFGGSVVRITTSGGRVFSRCKIGSVVKITQSFSELGGGAFGAF